VRFPLIAAIDQREFIAPFQEAIRGDYPVLRQETTQGVKLSPRGVEPGQALTAWRFNDIKGEWRVSLTPEFIALETTKYTSRDDFLSRLEFVLQALDEQIKPRVMQRLGLRYIDQITGEGFEKIDTLVRKEVLGILVGILGPEHSLTAKHSLSESLFEVPDSKGLILARWGLVPAGGVVDPSALEAIDEASWILDLDMFSTEQKGFSPEQIVGEARHFSERIYTLFRWVVTDDFLGLYGGKL
ncbi:TIGR04255 family protein, partial [Myxococcota bacterium]|nr:TIGR04255 family protein [Myxococcota bacterium]